MEIDYRKLREGDKVWACAYDYNNNRMEKSLIQAPVYGMIVKNGARYSMLGFAILKKDGTPRKSGIVDVGSRSYAKTEEECKEIYNKKIQSRIRELEKEITCLKDDLL